MSQCGNGSLTKDTHSTEERRSRYGSNQWKTEQQHKHIKQQEQQQQ